MADLRRLANRGCGTMAFPCRARPRSDTSSPWRPLAVRNTSNGDGILPSPLRSCPDVARAWAGRAPGPGGPGIAAGPAERLVSPEQSVRAIATLGPLVRAPPSASLLRPRAAFAQSAHPSRRPVSPLVRSPPLLRGIVRFKTRTVFRGRPRRRFSTGRASPGGAPPISGGSLVTGALATSLSGCASSTSSTSSPESSLPSSWYGLR